jgi:hypothetical protein
MVRARRIVRDPLVHFLIGGGLLFALYAAFHGAGGGAERDDTLIVVDRPALVNFLQYQSAAFQPHVFAAQFAAMSGKDKQALVARYVREEALVREGRAMGLDRVDYVIRERMVQKMTYLIDDAATATFQPGDAELQRYFAAHRADYQTAPTMTFTHVFVDREVDHPGGGRLAAALLKAELERRHAGFGDAPAYGDRFPYLQNYVQRTPDFVRSQFGGAFAAAMGKIRPSPHWQGPIASDYGYHLVLLTARAPAAPVTLSDVRDRVRDDLLHDAVAAYRDKALDDLVRRFTVRIEGLSVAMPARPSASTGSGAQPPAWPSVPGD